MRMAGIHPWNLCENRAKEGEKPPAYFYMPSFWGWEDNNIPNPVKGYFNYIVTAPPTPSHTHTHTHRPPPPLSAIPSLHKHTKWHHVTHLLASPLPTPCNYTTGRKRLFLGSVNVWLLLLHEAGLQRAGREGGGVHYKHFQQLDFHCPVWWFLWAAGVCSSWKRSQAQRLWRKRSEHTAQQVSTPKEAALEQSRWRVLQLLGIKK